MLIHNHQLNPTQLSELDALYAACQIVDGSAPAHYPHLLAQPREKNNLLCYTHQQLIGFLGVYSFYSDACEISLLVHPEHRHQGVARELLKTILPQLILKPIQRIVFSTPPSINDTWLSNVGCLYEESEYQMIRSSTQLEPIKTNHLTINKATRATIKTLCDIDAACFPGHPISPPSQFIQWLNNPDYHLFIAEIEDQIIGKAHIRREKEVAYLSDIAILPDFQKQGFGSELLTKMINEALQLGARELLLDVATHNTSNAVNLYLRHGFKILLQHDFWSISMGHLKHIVGSV